MADEREENLIEEVVSAHRERRDELELREHPAWHDLSDEGRRQAYTRTVEQRRLEAALDPEGLNTTARAVLARLTRT